MGGSFHGKLLSRPCSTWELEVSREMPKSEIFLSRQGAAWGPAMAPLDLRFPKKKVSVNHERCQATPNRLTPKSYHPKSGIASTNGMPPIQTTSPQTRSQVVDGLSFPCQENLKTHTHNKITTSWQFGIGSRKEPPANGW